MSADKTVNVDILGRETVSTAAGKAGAATDGLASKIEHLSGRLSNLGNVGQTASYAIGNALGNALSKLASMAAQGVQAGLQTAAAMEQAQISFETLEKSSSKAQGTLKELVNFANRTPFDTTNVIQYGKQLLASGLSADHLTKTMTALGDTSGALGLTQDQTSRVFLAWTQIMNRGKVQSQDLLQITEAGIPIWQVMSKALHKPVGALQDMAQKGKLVAKDVLPALEVQMEKDYGGAMAKQSQTLTGLWSTFTSTINTGMADVLKPFEGYLKGALKKAITDVGLAMTWLQTKGVPALIHFAKAVRENLGLIKNLAAGIGGAVVAMKGMSTAAGIVGALTALGPVGAAVAVSVLAIGAAFAYLYTSSGPFRGWINGAAQSAFNGLKVVVASLVGYWNTSLFPALKAAGQELLPKLSAAWGALMGAIGPGSGAFQFAGAALKILGSYIANLVVPWVKTLVGWWLDYLVPALKVFGWTITNVVVPVVGFLVKVMTTAFDWIIRAAATAFGWIPGIGPKLKGAAADFDHFKNDVNAALDGINDRHVNVTVAVTPITQPFSPSFGRNPSAGGLSIFGGGGGSISSGIGSIVSGAVSAIRGAAGQAASSGIGLGYGGGDGYGGIADAGSGGGSGAKKKKAHHTDPRIAVEKILSRGFIAAFQGTRKQAEAEFNKLFDALEKVGNKGASRIAHATERGMLTLVNKHVAFVTKIKAVAAQVKALQKAYNDEVKSTHDSVIASGDVGQSDGTYGGMVDRLRRSVAFATAFAGAIRQLRGMGMDSTTMQQLVAMGPEAGYQAAEALLASGKGGVGQIGTMQKQLSAAGNNLGKATADAMYGAGLHAAQGLLAGLQRSQKALVAQMERLAEALVATLRRKLGIHSPSTVFAELGGHIGAGLSMGLDGAAPMVAGSVGRLVSVPAGGSIAGAGRTGSGATVIEQHFHGDVIDKREVARLAAQGAASASLRGARVGGLRTAGAH